MKVYLASDHAGFELKQKVERFLKNSSYETEDCGAFEFNKDDDFPDFISIAAKKVSEDPESRGIVFGGSGQGEAIVANKFKKIRCSLFYGPVTPASSIDISGNVSHDAFEMLKLTREHNNSNMLSLGARFLSDEDSIKAVKLWLEAPFSGEERHLRRINKIKKLEENS